MTRTPTPYLLGVALGLLALAGCTADGPAVSGVVTLDGQPVEAAMVRFYRSTDANEPAYHAVTAKDGSFRMPAADSTHGGLPAGDYTVTVSKFKTGMMAMKSPKDASPEASSLPPVYSDAKRSPFKHALKSGANALELKLEGGAK